jgi:hypothetical protein
VPTTTQGASAVSHQARLMRMLPPGYSAGSCELAMVPKHAVAKVPYRYPSIFEPAVFAGWYGTFDTSGVQVNSAESDSAVRCRHGEFESSHGS